MKDKGIRCQQTGADEGMRCQQIGEKNFKEKFLITILLAVCSIDYPSLKVPPLSLQADLVIFFQPAPLQEFFPAHEWPLPPQSPEPLQELMPWHSPLTFMAGEDDELLAQPVAMSPKRAAPINVPFFECIISPFASYAFLLANLAFAMHMRMLCFIIRYYSVIVTYFF